ncbi:MAG TPA: PhzF family phenazine biosynthesis protein [Solirubrobacteraceae bacterium]|nr:PhzF family phenazine biosynthesis protein [Solirubrobacteraceae bacterium]
MRAYAVADVFTDVPLQGNPVAVFTDGQGLSGDAMQRTARELNLSETVFVLPGEDGANARVRIFTPAIELPFAGHPVLGAAFVLGQRLGSDTVALATGAGIVEVALRRKDDVVVFGEMAQPLPTWEPFAQPDELLAALRLERSALSIEVYDNGVRHTFACLEDDAAVAGLRPDLSALGELGQVGVSCFAVSDGARVKTRMFGPGLGVAEDPATGSAAGPLAVHLARHGRTGFGQRIEIHQGAEIGRPSTLFAQVDGTHERLERVAVGGGAVIVAEGRYLID